MLQAITSRNIVTPEGVRAGSVLFENGTIVAVESALPAEAEQVADVGELYLLPGLVDSHVHINEPGRTDWEGFETASRAAAAGGWTCLVDMPLNSVPTTIHREALDKKRECAKDKTRVDYAFWGGVVQGNSGDVPGLIAEGVRGFKAFLVDPGIPEFTEAREADLRASMPLIASAGLPLLVHCELPGPIETASQPSRSYQRYLRSRPPAAEIEAIELMIHLAREFRCRVHVVHLATAEALPMLRDARREGVPITIETCPHYLYFAAEDIPDGATQFKCAPPIRERSNNEQLWAALKDGTIDLVATDHSPCPPELKGLAAGDFFQAWGGIASLSLALPAMWTRWKQRGGDLQRLAKWMAQEPAKLAGLENTKGRIAVGCDADFAVFDPDATWQVTKNDLHFRHPVSPYLGEFFTGRVRQTFLRGNCIFDDGEFPGGTSGRECRLGPWSPL